MPDKTVLKSATRFDVRLNPLNGVSVMKTKKSKKLTLQDRLSRLTYVSTCQLLGEHGKQLLHEGGAFGDIDVQRDVYLGNDLFRLNVTDFSAAGDGVTNNDAALSAFNTAYAALSGRTRLIIPAGDYAFTTPAVWGTLGGDRLVIAAPGATLRNQLGFANSGLSNDDTHHANIATVSAGTDTVSLITPAQTSRFTSGQWVVVAGVDLQGGGYPINPGIFEFKQIDSIGVDALTFTEPLVNSYKSTWPNYNPGDPEIYQGGPATVYALLDAWDQEVEIQGASFTDTGGLFYGKVRVAKYTDCEWETYGPCPTVNVLFRMLRCTCSGTLIEVDKIVKRMEVIDSALRAIQFQSSSINELYVTGTTASLHWMGGAGGETTIDGLDTPEFRFGVTSYGVVKGNTTVNSCNSSNATWSNNYDFAFSNYTEEGSGVLSIAGGPVTWAIPGGWYVLTDSIDVFNGISFQVTDITASEGTTFIHTTLPDPVPATSGGRSAPWSIHPHPGSDVTAISCTGSTLFTDQSLLPANSPLFGWS